MEPFSGLFNKVSGYGLSWLSRPWLGFTFSSISSIFVISSVSFSHRSITWLSEAATEVLCKKGILKNFTRNYLCWGLFLIKLQSSRSARLLKRDWTQLFSGHIFETFKNTYFEERLQTTSELITSWQTGKETEGTTQFKTSLKNCKTTFSGGSGRDWFA